MKKILSMLLLSSLGSIGHSQTTEGYYSVRIFEASVWECVDGHISRMSQHSYAPFEDAADETKVVDFDDNCDSANNRRVGWPPGTTPAQIAAALAAQQAREAARQ